MITHDQIRAARAMLNLSLKTLAAECGLAEAELAALESGQRAGDSRTLESLRVAFERLGIVFLASGEDDPGVGPGLRLRRAATVDEGLRPENLNSFNDG
jgi:transcriptional regulator with XRE-family HTH domain